MSERRQLINLAYRLLGSLADAEDAVQETHPRWCAMNPEQQNAIGSPGAWLTTVASRICLDLLRSARARRERYVGEWVPEPLPDHTEQVTGRPGGPSERPGSHEENGINSEAEGRAEYGLDRPERQMRSVDSELTGDSP
jgi:RNA polymerase sigma-70 factor (ECF subfamily)